jgi:VanZ family protein
LRTFLKYNRWAIAWALLIILLTVLPGKVLPKIPDFLTLFKPDKIVHLIIFGIYVFLQIRGFLNQPVYPAVSRNAVILTLLISLSLAAGTELLQNFFIPMRLGSIYDFIANAAGCFIGWGIAWKLKMKE